MSVPRTHRPARPRRRAPRPLTAALAELLRLHRPPTTSEPDSVWICLTPATAAAIARVAARRAGSMAGYREHPAHDAARGPVTVPAATAQQWRDDAWQAAGDGLIAVADALIVAAQVDPPGAA